MDKVLGLRRDGFGINSKLRDENAKGRWTGREKEAFKIVTVSVKHKKEKEKRSKEAGRGRKEGRENLRGKQPYRVLLLSIVHPHPPFLLISSLLHRFISVIRLSRSSSEGLQSPLTMMKAPRSSRSTPRRSSSSTVLTMLLMFSFVVLVLLALGILSIPSHSSDSPRAHDLTTIAHRRVEM